MEELQKLLNMVSGADGSPSDVAEFLKGVAPEKLAEMEAAAIAAFTDIRKDPNFGRGDKERLTTLADSADLIRTEVKTRSAEDQTFGADVDALTERMMSPLVKPDTTATADDKPDGDGSPDGDGGSGDAAAADTAAAVPVAASATVRGRVDLASVKAHQPDALQPAKDPGSGVCLASADVPGFGTGWVIRDDAELARAITARFAGMPLGTMNVGPISAGVAQYERRMPPELTASSQRSLEKALEYACDEKSLPGGSLIAAASSCGWCSPPERDWTLCTPLESADAGNLRLPAVTVNRGGLEYTTNTPWWQIYQSVPDQTLTVPGFVCDKADGTPCEPLDPCPPDKTCITIPCPSWTKCIPKVSVLCIEAPILMNEAWPEAVTHFVGRARTAFRRRANARYLAQMAAQTLAAQGGTPYLAVPSIGAAGSVFDTIALQTSWYRDLNKMPFDATLQGVAPAWLREVLRADLAKRDGCGCETITNARIEAELAELRVQMSWVYDWQPLATIAGSPAAPVKINAWPATVDIMLFPFGTWALGLSNVITLNAVYDSTNLKKNVFTELFMEDKWCLLQRCNDSMLIRIPLCVGGGTGPRVDLCNQSPVSAVQALAACGTGTHYECVPDA